jgi:inorganic pyrophosphatase
MSRNGIRSGLADPSRLEPIVDDDDDEIIEVVIETPKGSRNKYAFDPEERTFTLKEGAPGRYDLSI